MCFFSSVKSSDGTKAAAICFQQYGLSQAIALLPVAYRAKRITGRQLLANLGWVYLGNLLGSVCYGGMFALTLSLSSAPQTTIGPLLIVAAEAKTIAYASHGLSGFLVCVVKAVLCNWMVCLGVIAAMTSTSALGKIIASGMPILIFFALGFEHSVVNMFVIPTGMILGAKVSFADWWLWNQIPVTVGNLLGGWLLIGLPLYLTYGKQSPTRERLPATKSSEVPHEAKKRLKQTFGLFRRLKGEDRRYHSAIRPVPSGSD